MARIRTVKPEFFTDDKVGECSPTARLLFIGALVFADDYGNLDRSAKQLKAQVFPHDAVECDGCLDELISHGLVVEYEVDGKKYLHIKNFDKHQKVEKKSRARFPLYNGSANGSGGLGEGSRLKGREVGSVEAFASAEALARDKGSGSFEGKEKKKPPTKAKRRVVGKSPPLFSPGGGPENSGGGSPPEPDVPVELVRASTWRSYAKAYEERWSQAPARNGKANALVAQLVSRIGRDAPQVARFYCGHPEAFYVRAQHPLTLLLRDAEGLRTQWANGHTVTSTAARQQEQTAARFQLFNDLIEEREQEERDEKSKLGGAQGNGRGDGVDGNTLVGGSGSGGGG